MYNSITIAIIFVLLSLLQGCSTTGTRDIKELVCLGFCQLSGSSEDVIVVVEDVDEDGDLDAVVKRRGDD